jgi:hypothetical protein
MKYMRTIFMNVYTLLKLSVSVAANMRAAINNKTLLSASVCFVGKHRTK